MKDQYFGDVNDYRKYGLLRAILAGTNVRLGVCWMLTAPDNRRDGRHLAYLDNPGTYRLFDHELFDWLQQTIHEYPDRRTARIEATSLLAGAVYFAELLEDDPSRRKAWFASCLRQLEGCDVVFFDPDNGLERTIPFGRRQSHKFLCWEEVRETFSTGASVLVYQHFPREDRVAYTERLAGRLRAETGASAIFSFRTPHVLFLLAARERHTASFRDVVRKLPLLWPEKEIAAREMQPILDPS
jgi:hypothetical protein